MPINDGDLATVRAIAAGDRQALAALYDRFAPLLLGLAVRMLRDRRDAEDLLHDVFLEVHRHAADFDETRGSVRAWLVTRLRSRAIDRLKSFGNSRVIPMPPPSFDDREAETSDVVALADASALRRALFALPAEQRRALELSFFEGLSSAEIAAEAGVPIGTVKSRLATALSRLRTALAQDPPPRGLEP